MNKQGKILVCAHKKDFIYSNDIYMPIHVGKALSDVDLQIQGDDTGDNISSKNKYYCELTAQYWAWKNLKGIDYIGLAHYRRYLNFKSKTHRLWMNQTIKSCQIPNIDFEKELSDCDMIVSQLKTLPVSIKVDYCKRHISQDLLMLRETIGEVAPEYLKTYDHMTKHTNTMSICNMFVCKWDLFNDYSEWLFRILFATEKKVKISEYDYQARVFGFMAERLMNVYIQHHKLKVKKHPIILITDEKARHSSLFYEYFTKAKHKLQFWVSEL